MKNRRKNWTILKMILLALQIMTKSYITVVRPVAAPTALCLRTNSLKINIFVSFSFGFSVHGFAAQ